MLRTFLVLILAANVLLAGESPISPEAREQLQKVLLARLKSAEDALAKTPDDTDLLSQRGDARLFAGDAKGAVVDFEKEIALDPSHDAPHWRLGIAYYFAGEFAKSARQFAKYHAFDGHDRENGVWKFFAQARVDGIEKARKEMLEYTAFDREPFPAIYDMLAGKTTTAEVLADLEKRSLQNDPQVMFFAHYYIGVNEEILGHAGAAREHLAAAVRLSVQARSGYMGQCARLHFERLK